ncbi:secretion protein [Burkholderia sp. BE17]|uniref:secretion protein n=1 Tax=Burkholderia sp. BE17 TaxID=2656644 RepID=UPI00128E6338|nr:secretion protein [Burkholderia sp. BE17]MPV67775.1 secretion protein [Burkholderia sp. BE17]
MKLLRILTGVHAGAQLQLAPGTHRIGSDDGADIRLTDWHAADLFLHVTDDVVRAQFVEPEASKATPAADSPDAVLFVDLVPKQFNGTVLCVGPDATAWPSDFELLSILILRRETRPVWNRRYARTATACIAVGSIILAVVAITSSQTSRAAPPPNVGFRAQRITGALAAAHIDGLQARPVGNTVVVTGIVARATDATAVRTLLASISTSGIVSRYDVAQQVSRSIEESLGIPGAQVEYSGGGRFVVKGLAGSREALEAAVARIRSDLDPNVTEVTVVATESAAETAAKNPTSYAEMVSADDVQYAQTPDGVKHIYVTDTPTKASDSAAVSGTASPATDNVPPLPPGLPG